MNGGDILRRDTVALDEKENALVIIDQTLLPGEVKMLSLRRQGDIREAIYMLRVRGAPAIGVAAAIGLYLAALEIDTDSADEFFGRLAAAKAYLAAARPTAVNLFWALDRMERAALACREKPIGEIKARLRDEAVRIREEDIETCRKIGENGLTLLRNGCGVLTHCNAGQLATTRYGTALAPIHLGRERGWNFRVFCDETRPLLQGARLSAYELLADGVDTTVICDNMASQVMKNGWVDAVLVGADRIAANGDACNKIGTSGVAILARHYGVPFYVLGPAFHNRPHAGNRRGNPDRGTQGRGNHRNVVRFPHGPQRRENLQPRLRRDRRLPHYRHRHRKRRSPPGLSRINRRGVPGVKETGRNGGLFLGENPSFRRKKGSPPDPLS